MNRIKEVLEKKGVAQTWLAEKLGKSYNMVNSYAQNRRQRVLRYYLKLEKYLESVHRHSWRKIIETAFNEDSPTKGI